MGSNPTPAVVVVGGHRHTSGTCPSLPTGAQGIGSGVHDCGGIVMYEERHVLPGPAGEWNVAPTGARRPASRHRTPREAVLGARRALLEEGGELLIHGRDGEVHARVTYPPPGRRSRRS